MNQSVTLDGLAQRSASCIFGRVQVNYVVASGDELAYTGVRGFHDNGVLVQFQVQFDVRN